MELFQHIFTAFREFLDKKDVTTVWDADVSHPWPAGGNRNIVMADTMAVELGNPSAESLSAVLWTEDLEQVSDGAITLIGPDIPESGGVSLPYAKIVLLGVDGFNEENTCDRFGDLELVKYDVDLRGFMLRALSRRQSEWCRIDRDAWGKGFSFRILGSDLIRLFREKAYVHSAEVVFVTSGRGDVIELKGIMNDVTHIVGALDKMSTDLSFDCSTCEYQTVCDDVSGLRSMHASMRNRRRK